MLWFNRRLHLTTRSTTPVPKLRARDWPNATGERLTLGLVAHYIGGVPAGCSVLVNRAARRSVFSNVRAFFKLIGGRYVGTFDVHSIGPLGAGLLSRHR